MSLQANWKCADKLLPPLLLLWADVCKRAQQYSQGQMILVGGLRCVWDPLSRRPSAVFVARAPHRHRSYLATLRWHFSCSFPGAQNADKHRLQVRLCLKPQADLCLVVAFSFANPQIAGSTQVELLTTKEKKHGFEWSRNQGTLLRFTFCRSAVFVRGLLIFTGMEQTSAAFCTFIQRSTWGFSRGCFKCSEKSVSQHCVLVVKYKASIAQKDHASCAWLAVS